MATIFENKYVSFELNTGKSIYNKSIDTDGLESPASISFNFGKINLKTHSNYFSAFLIAASKRGSMCW